jgi:hypothetical protein
MSITVTKIRSVFFGHTVITTQVVEAVMWSWSMKIGDLVETRWDFLSGIWVIVGWEDDWEKKKYHLQNVATGELCLLHYTNIEPLEVK